MSEPPFWLTTERLGLRPFTSNDLDWLAELLGDPYVMRYLGGAKNRAKATEVMNTRILSYYDEHPNLGVWKTVDRDTGTAVGFHLLNHIRGEPDIQVGFTLAKSAWGKGFATEMASELLRYGFIDLKLARITGVASLQNDASQRVLRKIGLERRGERAFTHADFASEGAMAWFERDASDWLAERWPV